MRVDSTTTPLGNAGAWTSQVLETGLADKVTGMVFADQGGTIFIEQSADNQNWDISTSYAIAASDGKGFSEEILGPYLRVRYVNGATPQGSFRLHVRMSSAGPR